MNLTSDLRAQTSGTKPSASFAGFLNQTEISKAYVAAEVLVLPSDYHETWGLVVNEAMASGLPCIVSDLCGCAEDLAPGDCVFATGSSEGLAQLLARFHVNPKNHDTTTRLPSFAVTIETVVRLSKEVEARNKPTA